MQHYLFLQTIDGVSLGVDTLPVAVAVDRPREAETRLSGEAAGGIAHRLKRRYLLKQD